MPSTTEAAITPEQARTIAEAGIAGFRVSNGLIKKSLEGLHDDHWIATTHEGGNHILWSLGHLVASNDYFGQIVGAESSTPSNYGELFGYGSDPVADLTRYPSPADVTAEYDKSCEQFVSAWSSADPEKIAAKPDGSFGDMFPAVAHLAMFAGQHEMTHIGQILNIRRMLGLPRVIG